MLTQQKNKGFTLIELLITIGILAGVATVTVLVLNPAQLFAQSRDTVRLQDITGLEKALNYVLFAEKNNGYDPLATYIFTSLPEPFGPTTCDSHVATLPPVGPWWFYWCTDTAHFNNIDGSGWIPADFGNPFGYQQAQYQKFLAAARPSYDPSGAVITKLPTDPRNNLIGGSNYTYFYIPGDGTYELITKFESTKYQDKALNDGGFDPDYYEVGPDKTLWKTARGL